MLRLSANTKYTQTAKKKNKFHFNQQVNEEIKFRKGREDISKK